MEPVPTAQPFAKKFITEVEELLKVFPPDVAMKKQLALAERFSAVSEKLNSTTLSQKEAHKIYNNVLAPALSELRHDAKAERYKKFREHREFQKATAAGEPRPVVTTRPACECAFINRSMLPKKERNFKCAYCRKTKAAQSAVEHVA